MNFFKLYMGDYQRDTGALSIAEHGAYFLMLQYHYATEKPLPTGKDLYRLLRCESKADRCAVDAVAKQFWNEAGGGLVNNRAQEEIAGTHAYAEAQSQRANKRWNKPTDMPVHMPTHVQMQSPIDASHSHSQKNTLPVPGFDAFYSAYPRKVAKPAALKAWKKLSPDDALVERIVSMVEHAKWPVDDTFIPHPATWLNQRRWEDELAAPEKLMRVVT